MSSLREPDDAHAAALERAYALVEAAQGEEPAAALEVADEEAARHGWVDVAFLMCFARSLADRQGGLDDSRHVQAMLDLAQEIQDPALLALALATSATRHADLKRPWDLSESTATPLVQAVGLLDDAEGPVVHRVAAQIEVASAAHSLGFWELAIEYYDLAEQSLDADGDPRWGPTARRQRRVLDFNRIEEVLDWVSAEAAIGGWAAAGARAAAVLPGSLEALDADWPPSWVIHYRCHLHLLAALAAPDASLNQTHALSPQDSVPGVPVGAMLALGAAIRATRLGDPVRAAQLADGLAARLAGFVPTNTRLLCLSIAARHPGASAAAITYADELAALRWNARLDQMGSMREAIAVERQRREHEHLRRQVLVDELTGLANRRGYHAYLTGLSTPAGPGEDESAVYAVMMVDVDHFKGVNDQFGHDVGDLVLARIAQVLALHVRPMDLAARLGGDEFVVILARVRPHVPAIRAQEIIDAVRDQPWDELAPGLRVSISVGVHDGGIQQLPSLLMDADRQLYRAKKEGRGRFAAQTVAAERPAIS